VQLPPKTQMPASSIAGTLPVTRTLLGAGAATASAGPSAAGLRLRKDRLLVRAIVNLRGFPP
jgi:hypothetical protein